MNAIVKPSIVIVDDEPQVLRALEDQLEDLFEVHAVASGARALQLVESLKEVSVLLSDQRMPGMTGDELFMRAAEVSDATPVMITGYADLEAVIRAVNHGRLFGYVTKPWEREQLQIALHKAAEHHRLVRDLQHEKDLLRNLMDNMPDEVFFKDREHRYIRLNATAARNQFGTSPDAALGRRDADFLNDRALIEQWHEETSRVLSTGLPLEVDELRTRPDGTPYWVSKIKAPMRDHAGAVSGVVAIARDITWRREAEEALKRSEAGLRQAETLAKLGHVITGADGEFESWSETFPRLAGLVAEDLPRSLRGWMKLIVEADQPAFQAAVIDAARRHARSEVAYRLRRSDGTTAHLHHIADPLTASGVDDQARWFNTVQDVTEARTQEAHIVRLARMHAMLSGINSTIVRVQTRDELFSEACRLAVETGGFRNVYIRLADEGGTALLPVASFNPAGLEIGPLPLQGPGSEQARLTTAGRAFVEGRVQVANDLRTDDLRSDIRALAIERDVLAVASLPLRVGEKTVGEITFGATEAGFFDAEEVRLLEELAGDIGFALDHFEKAARVDYLSYYDPLTGIANAALFRQRLAQQLSAAAQDEAQVALLVLDLERFRVVNDSLGRAAGDALLKNVAQRISGTITDPSWMARLDGNRFAFFLPDFATVEELARRTEHHLRQFFGEPFEVAGQPLRISARAGIAVYPDDAVEVEALFGKAESALRNAKERGERYLFFEQRMTERVAERLSLEGKLRQALERDEFVLHYQPKVSAHSRRIVGVEALIRWQSPELGLVPPGKFIPLMEETGMILEAGAWALRRAVAERRAWQALGGEVPRVAVNVSAWQLRQKDFVQTLEAAIGGVHATAGLDIEITESLLMEDIETSIEKLKAVHALGVQIAIDDFGTGYSSLAYLARLPLQSLKIDRAFINGMQDDPNATTLVSTMISLAHALELKVVAEGVETEEQARMLRLLRCDEMQGYLFSKPLFAEELLALLAQQSGH